MREIKFRAWHEKLNRMIYGIFVCDSISEWVDEKGKSWCVSDSIMQYTGLKDKNGLTELYEGDIIGLDGIKKGNQYENADLLKDQSNLLIQGFGTKDWETTNKEAMGRGCGYSE